MNFRGHQKIREIKLNNISNIKCQYQKGFLFMFKQPMLLSYENHWVQELMMFNLWGKMWFDMNQAPQLLFS